MVVRWESFNFSICSILDLGYLYLILSLNFVFRLYRELEEATLDEWSSSPSVNLSRLLMKTGHKVGNKIEHRYSRSSIEFIEKFVSFDQE